MDHARHSVIAAKPRAARHWKGIPIDIDILLRRLDQIISIGIGGSWCLPDVESEVSFMPGRVDDAYRLVEAVIFKPVLVAERIVELLKQVATIVAVRLRSRYGLAARITTGHLDRLRSNKALACVIDILFVPERNRANNPVCPGERHDNLLVRMVIAIAHRIAFLICDPRQFEARSEPVVGVQEIFGVVESE
jgi:hypothetical protein